MSRKARPGWGVPPHARPKQNSNNDAYSGNEDRRQATASRHERRQFDRGLRALLKQSGGDHCTICLKPFLHKGSTFAGLTADEIIANVGHCCVDKLRSIHALGMYLSAVREKRPNADFIATVMKQLPGLPEPRIEVLINTPKHSVELDAQHLADEHAEPVAIVDEQGKLLAYRMPQ
jgi:hypothetical protein